jgi:hypothetical protein
MLPIDHVPFYANSLDALRTAFTRLGFTVSPRGRYTSGERADAVWPNHSVFMQRGWFDLLLDARPDAALGVAPGACLFLASDIAQEARKFAREDITPVETLTRAWDEPVGAHRETFAYVTLRKTQTPLSLSIIAHAYPCPDTIPAWFAHPNGAVALSGATFAADEPAWSRSVRETLDLSALKFTSAADFASSFGSVAAGIAIRVSVSSLRQTGDWLRANNVAFDAKPGALNVPPQFGLQCAFSFEEN